MDIVTIRQAKKLKKLGFNEETCHYLVEGLDVKPMKSYPTKWNTNKGYNGIKPKYPYIAVPTVRQAFLWLSKKAHDRKIGFLCVKTPHALTHVGFVVLYTQTLCIRSKTYTGVMRKAIAILIRKLENG